MTIVGAGLRILFVSNAGEPNINEAYPHKTCDSVTRMLYGGLVGSVLSKLKLHSQTQR